MRDVVKLVQNLVFLWTFCSFFVELKNINHCLRVLPSFLLGDSTLADETLPFFRETLVAR